jgi:hypothetical protein
VILEWMLWGIGLAALFMVGWVAGWCLFHVGKFWYEVWKGWRE